MMDPQQTNVGQKAQEKTSELADQARQKTGEIAQQAQETAKTTMQQQKGRAAETVSTFADALRQTGQHLNDNNQANFGQFAEQAAQKIEQFSNDLQDKSVDEIFVDVQNFARRDPQLFLGGAVVLGLLAARFLKSSSQRQRQMQMGQYGQYGRYTGQYGRPGYYGSGQNRGYYNRTDLDEYRRDVVSDEYTGTYNRGSYTTNETGMASDADFSTNDEFGATESGRGYSTGTSGMSGTSGMNRPTGTPRKSESDPFTGQSGDEPRIPPYPGSGSRTNE